MKNKTQNEKLAKSQTREFVADEPSGSYKHINGVKQIHLFYGDRPALRKASMIIQGGARERLLTQNLGKAPPGQTRYRGDPRGHPPEGQAGPPDIDIGDEIKRIKNKAGKPADKYLKQIENENFNKYKKSKHYKHLNFTTMKKQILFLMVFLLVAFTSINNSYGQCTPDPLHPAPGVAYDYTVAISGTTGGTNPTYLWYVTQDVDVLNGVQIASGSDFTVNSGTGTATLNVTWASTALANGNPYYLVVKYTETSTAGCDVENLKVWSITPVNTFLLAVAGSDATGDETKATVCPPAVDGATVTPGASPTVEYTYGQTIIYYKITASGVNGTWTPSIQLPSIASISGGLGQNYNDAEWTGDNGTTWHSFGLTDGDIAGGSYTSTDVADVTVAGTPIIVRIKIDNVNFESLALQSITLGADGILPGGTKDIKSTSDCADEVDFGKTGTSTIEPRPTVTPAPATGAFITKNP